MKTSSQKGALIVALIFFWVIGLWFLLVALVPDDSQTQSRGRGERIILAEQAAEERMPQQPGTAPYEDEPTEDEEVHVPPPPFSDGIFPCSDCHSDMEVNTQRRELVEEHTNIKLHHGPETRWCLDCHNPDNRDRLRLASGELVEFSESYKLCGQCHGEKLRDWKAGVHGKRTGYFKGPKTYLLCPHCHNPHAPKFRPIHPEPPPVRPENIR